MEGYIVAAIILLPAAANLVIDLTNDKARRELRRAQSEE